VALESVTMAVQRFRSELDRTRRVGDRHSLKLGETFCSPGATKAVAHELQRLIIEVAEANPHARS